MATSFSAGRSRSTRREPPTMGKQLVNFITGGCESSAPFLAHLAKNCLWRPCLLTDRDKMSILYRGPFTDASYQVSVHLAKRFQRRRFKKIDQSEPLFPLEFNQCWYSVTCLSYTLQVGIHILIFFLANLAKGNTTNQKQELPVVAMFVNRSGQNEHSL
jgi:hypothetical protein